MFAQGGRMSAVCSLKKKPLFCSFGHSCGNTVNHDMLAETHPCPQHLDTHIPKNINIQHIEHTHTTVSQDYRLANAEVVLQNKNETPNMLCNSLPLNSVILRVLHQQQCIVAMMKQIVPKNLANNNNIILQRSKLTYMGISQSFVVAPSSQATTKKEDAGITKKTEM